MRTYRQKGRNGEREKAGERERDEREVRER